MTFLYKITFFTLMDSDLDFDNSGSGLTFAVPFFRSSFFSFIPLLLSPHSLLLELSSCALRQPLSPVLLLLFSHARTCFTLCMSYLLPNELANLFRLQPSLITQRSLYMISLSFRCWPNWINAFHLCHKMLDSGCPCLSV